MLTRRKLIFFFLPLCVPFLVYYTRLSSFELILACEQTREISRMSHPAWHLISRISSTETNVARTDTRRQVLRDPRVNVALFSIGRGTRRVVGLFRRGCTRAALSFRCRNNRQSRCDHSSLYLSLSLSFSLSVIVLITVFDAFAHGVFAQDASIAVPSALCRV